MLALAAITTAGGVRRPVDLIVAPFVFVTTLPIAWLMVWLVVWTWRLCAYGWQELPAAAGRVWQLISAWAADNRSLRQSWTLRTPAHRSRLEPTITVAPSGLALAVVSAHGTGERPDSLASIKPEPPMTQRGAWDYDVALSFAGENRAFVEQVAIALDAAGIRVFYDAFEMELLWGANLFDQLEAVYGSRARFVVAFISREYAGKPWPRHERQSAQRRALLNDDHSFLPVRLDDSVVPGLDAVGYLDAASLTPAEVAAKIRRQLSWADERRHEVPPPTQMDRVPTTQSAIELIANMRPPYWEYLLYGGYLVTGRDGLEPRWRDHELGLIRPSGDQLSAQEVVGLVQECLGDLVTAADNLGRLFEPATLARAFGPPGVPGDPAAIAHVAHRLIEVYAQLLTASETIRAARVPVSCRRSQDLAAQLTSAPLHRIRSFITDYEQAVNGIPQRLRDNSGEALRIDVALTLEFDRRVSKLLTSSLRSAIRQV